MSPTGKAPKHFLADLERFDKVLAPFTFLVDGYTYLTTDAPAEVAACYRRLICMAAANGWVA